MTLEKIFQRYTHLIFLDFSLNPFVPLLLPIGKWSGKIWVLLSSIHSWWSQLLKNPLSRLLKCSSLTLNKKSFGFFHLDFLITFFVERKVTWDEFKNSLEILGLIWSITEFSDSISSNEYLIRNLCALQWWTLFEQTLFSPPFARTLLSCNETWIP